MAITRIQSLALVGTGAASKQITFPSPVTPGNLLIAYGIDSVTNSNDVFVISDNVNAGNYHNDVNPTLAGLCCGVIASLPNTLSGTPTVTIAGSAIWEVGIEEWSGIVSSSPLDQIGSGNDSFSLSTVTATTAGSISQGSELVLGVISAFNARTITANSGTLGLNPDGHFASSYLILTSGSGTQIASFNLSGASNDCFGVATYKAAPTGTSVAWLT